MHLFFERESHERPLDCHAKFLDYQKLIDRLLSEFVQEEAVPTEEIAGFCKLLVEACDDSPTPLMCVDYILAALDYVYFDDLMVEHRKMREWHCDDISKYGRILT
eukprot:GEMP01106342.1.p1 GENE.GEMP01106342.1~~GEMP01106342.1.p1  ORF type:complete len:105 (+),score=21.04 GEMP01106342.1:157-471(+)